MFVAAAFAPAIVWVLWRLQAASVNHLLRPGLYQLLRYQRVSYAVVSWFGVLLHEIAHAVVLLLGGHGIRKFKVGVDAGHVVPKQIRRGPFGLLSFLAAALAPIYAAPGIILLLLVLLHPGLITIQAPAAGLLPAWNALQTIARDFAEGLVLRLARLDLATPGDLAVFLLALLAMPAARPSFVKNKEKDEGDIAVVRSKVREHPWTILVFFAILYGLYFLVPFAPRVYWGLFQVLWAIALTGIILAAAGGILWWLLGRAGRALALVAWLAPAAGIAAQVVPRLVAVPLLDSPLAINLASFVLFAGLAFALPLAAPRRF
jgi:hypothetical protein